MKNYTAMEKRIILDCAEMGFSNQAIAEFVNKKEHNRTAVRTTEAIRKFIARNK